MYSKLEILTEKKVVWCTATLRHFEWKCPRSIMNLPKYMILIWNICKWVVKRCQLLHGIFIFTWAYMLAMESSSRYCFYQIHWEKLKLISNWASKFLILPFHHFCMHPKMEHAKQLNLYCDQLPFAWAIGGFFCWHHHQPLAMAIDHDFYIYRWKLITFHCYKFKCYKCKCSPSFFHSKQRNCDKTESIWLYRLSGYFSIILVKR